MARCAATTHTHDTTKHPRNPTPHVGCASRGRPLEWGAGHPATPDPACPRRHKATPPFHHLVQPKWVHVIATKTSRPAPQHRLTGVTRYPRWGAEVGTPDMYNSQPAGSTPLSKPRLAKQCRVILVHPTSFPSPPHAIPQRSEEPPACQTTTSANPLNQTPAATCASSPPPAAGPASSCTPCTKPRRRTRHPASRPRSHGAR